MDSARVRLEVAILAGDQASPVADPGVASDGHGRLTVLVVATDADVRRYVRECLRECADVRVLEAMSVTMALTVEARTAPHILVVDAPQSEVLVALPGVRAVVIVDDAPCRAQASDARVRFLARPFSTDQLVAEIGLVRR
jgi:DNA-binding response OmpR family regulator